MPAITGANVVVNYYWEDNGFAQSPNDSTAKVPGANARLDTAEATNNGTRVYLPDSNRAVDIRSGSFEGAFALSFTLTNPWWLRAIYGSPSASGAGPTYTYDYDSGPGDSFQLVEGYEGESVERTLTGCVATRAAITPDVGEETVSVTLEGFYANDSTSTGTVTSQATLSEDPLQFSDATLKVGGAAESVVQNASLELATNSQAIRGFGSRFPTDYAVGAFEPTVSYTKIKQDEAALQDVYGGTSSMAEDIENTQSFDLEFDNGDTGADTNTITFSSTLSFPESYDETGVGDPDSPIEEDLNRLLADVTVQAVNGTSSAP